MKGLIHSPKLGLLDAAMKASIAILCQSDRAGGTRTTNMINPLYGSRWPYYKNGKLAIFALDLGRSRGEVFDIRE